MLGGVGLVGMAGRIGQGRRVPSVQAGAADFTLSAATVTPIWDVRTVGDLVPVNAPAGSFFVAVGEPAGLAVVNG